MIRNESGVPIVGQLDDSDNWVFIDGDGTEVSPSDRHPFSSNPLNLVPFGGALYFSADGVLVETVAGEEVATHVGRELWVTNGN